jgi:two-component system sensor histidine kinase YesM
MKKKERKKTLGVHSIQTKILAVCLIIAIGTTSVSLMISYFAEISTIKETTEKYMEQYIAYADQDFNNMLGESKKIMLSIAMAQELISPNLVAPGQEAAYESFQKKKQIKSFLAGFLSQKDYIEDILLITKDGEVYQAGSEFIAEKDLESPVMKKARSAKVLEIQYDDSDRKLILCRPAFYQNNHVEATIIVKLNYEYITSVYQSEPLQSVVVYLYLPDGQLLYTNREQDPGEIITKRESSTGYVEWNGNKQYYIRYESAASRMIMVSMIPQKVLLKDAADLRNKFILIGIGSAAAAVLMSIYLSQRICANIKKLASGMEAVRSGDLSVRMKINVLDEIGELTDTFNMTMDRIEHLMEEVKLKEKRKREAEQEVLASQIEPHFLYNTIDSIQYVSHMRGETEIEEVAKSLSELLRSVLSNHNDLITLWEEREYIENYMNIERFKYRKPFSVLWDVEEELWVYSVPKLLLQPIVENALIHGIAEKENGVIHIKIYKQLNEVICKVMDNGKGMKEETVHKLREEIEEKNKSGFRRIGIANVFNRIQLLYGEPYGGTISSCEGMFTCVELHLPLRGGEEDVRSINS